LAAFAFICWQYSPYFYCSAIRKLEALRTKCKWTLKKMLEWTRLIFFWERSLYIFYRDKIFEKNLIKLYPKISVRIAREDLHSSRSSSSWTGRRPSACWTSETPTCSQQRRFFRAKSHWACLLFLLTSKIFGLSNSNFSIISLQPAAVALHGGPSFKLHIVLNVVLCVLGWIPGILHAIWYCFMSGFWTQYKKETMNDVFRTLYFVAKFTDIQIHSKYNT
jgi:uncharacterized membrane protein YqaE (UPF0057 family)